MRPRILFAILVLAVPGVLAAAANAKVVINEVDYDQPGTDTGEFIELLNLGPGAENLDPYTVELVNGSGGGAAIYQTIDLPLVTLAVGDTYVICGNGANVAHCDLDVTPDLDLIQNGAPDAIGLRKSGVLIDAVSYEGNTGAPYTEGTGTVAADDNITANVGLARTNGIDTDNNNADFTLQSITPGLPSVPFGSPALLALLAAGLMACGAWWTARARVSTPDAAGGRVRRG